MNTITICWWSQLNMHHILIEFDNIGVSVLYLVIAGNTLS